MTDKNPVDPPEPALSKAPSLNKVRDFLRKSVQFQRFAGHPLTLQPEDRHDDDSESQSSSHGLVDTLEHDLHDLQRQLSNITHKVTEIKEENESELRRMAGLIKRDMERLGQIGEQLDDFEEYVQLERDNINTQLEEMEAKIHHQITNQYSDLQEAIERLYLRMDTLEKAHREQKEQADIEEKETSYFRHFAVKAVNCVLTLAQVVLVLVNTVAETVRPLSSNIGNICFVSLVLFTIALFRDDDIRQASERSLKRTFPVLNLFG